MNYSSLVRDFVDRSQEADQILSTLMSDLLGLKDSVPPEKASLVAKAITQLANAQMGVHSAREAVEQVLQTRESVDETVLDLAGAMIEHGYSRNVRAPADEVWYAHPSGHQLRAKPMAGKVGVCWEHFPPDLRRINRGFGMDRLREHLQLAHRDQQQEALADPLVQDEKPSPEAADAFNTPYRDFLIVQTDVAPVERFLVRESDETYPHIIAHYPKTGEWRDYTVEARGEPKDDRYVQMVKRWIYLGRPFQKGGNTQPSAVGQITQAQVADGGYERPPRGSGSAIQGMPDRTPRI